MDTYIRSGAYAGGPHLPYIPGKDGSGVIIDVGSKVERLKAGDRVYFTQCSGSYATHTIAKAANVSDERTPSPRSVPHFSVPTPQTHLLPPKLPFPEGACVGVPYHTAYRALFQKGGAKPGDSVLIHGASGGVGSAALQLAANKNIAVVGHGLLSLPRASRTVHLDNVCLLCR